VTAGLAQPIQLTDLRGDRRRRRRESGIRSVFVGAGLVSIVISAAIVFALIEGAVNFLARVDLSTLWSEGWFPRRGEFDIKTLLVGTLLVAGIAMVVAAPIGLGSAIYLSEYARPRVRRALKPILEILAGIPSVVLGYFAISFVTPSVIQKFNGDASFFNLAAAGICVGILTIPIVASVSEDALRAVPQSLREASYGLGSRRMATSVRVVVPAAVSGIVAAFVIGISRAIGETMVVAIASGATGGSLFSLDVFQPGQTMTAAMAALGAGTDQVVGVDAASQSLYFLGLLLFLMTFILNLAGELFVRRVRQRY
jgi:phosphate transport system permease protein